MMRTQLSNWTLTNSAVLKDVTSDSDSAVLNDVMCDSDSSVNVNVNLYSTLSQKNAFNALKALISHVTVTVLLVEGCHM